MKKTLTILSSTAAALAIVVPVAQASLDSTAPYRAHAAKAKTTKVVKVAKRQSSRVLCICVSGPSNAPVLTEQQLEDQANQDAIDHGMPPVYDNSATSDNSSTSDDGSNS